MYQMRRKYLDLWLTALRSGQYSQTTGQLRNTCDPDKPSGFCCLGVLSDLVMDELGCKWSQYDEFTRDGSVICATMFLPEVVASHVGLTHPGARFLPNDIRHLEGFTAKAGTLTCASIANLNDNGYSFEELADILEKVIEPVD